MWWDNRLVEELSRKKKKERMSELTFLETAIEKICWKFGYVYLPEGNIFKNGIGDMLTKDQRDYFLKLCEKHIEMSNEIFWNGVKFAQLRKEDKVKILIIVGLPLLDIEFTKKSSLTEGYVYNRG
jgi:hypothetical protein